MKYYLKILNRTNSNGHDHIFIVNQNDTAIPNQVKISIIEDLECITVELESYHLQPKLHENKEEAARIYWEFKGIVNGQKLIEDIPFELIDKSEDPVFEK